MSTIAGGSGNDTLTGTGRAEVVNAGDGHDRVTSGSGNDTIFGGAGNDTIVAGTDANPATTLDLNWALQGPEGTNIANGFSQDAGGMNVNVRFTNDGNATAFEVDQATQVYTAAGEAFATNSSLYLTGTGAGHTSTTSISFAPMAGSGFGANVDNVRFRINDIDRSTLYWRDVITIRAYDAAGKAVPVVITAAGNDSVSGGTITAGNTIDAPGVAQGSALVQIAGPVARFEIDYNNTYSSGQAIWVSDVHFDVQNTDYDLVEGGLGNDSVLGGLGEDTLHGQEGDDRLFGETGNDLLYGGADQDALFGGAGNDTLFGGTGHDTLDGGIGDDLIKGDNGNDSLTGGAGHDTLHGGHDNDTLFGGDGNDYLYGEDGHDSLVGGLGNDTLFGGLGDDVLDGGEGDDQLLFGDGNDLIFGGAGNDFIDDIDGALATGDDTVYAGAGNDTVYTGHGDDKLFGDAGRDMLVGETGNDQLYGGDDGDTLYGGDGNDTLQGDGGADLIYGGNDRDVIFGGLGDTVDGGGGGDDFDILNLSQYAPGTYRINYDPTNIENGTVDFLDLEGRVTGTLKFTEIEKVVPCFTPGTLIATPQGPRAIETLQEGDWVLTRDSGMQPVRWIGQRDLGLAELIVRPQFCPVRIAKGALGNGLPQRDLLVSPQHRMLVQGALPEMLFGESEVLVAAVHLVGQPGISQNLSRAVRYIHMMFDQHEIVMAEGAWSESFQPGQATLEGMEAAQRQEVLALFPELADDPRSYPAARMTLKAHEVRVLIAAQ